MNLSKSFSLIDHVWMRRALALARRGAGATLPNPQVGAVLVRQGKNLGEGYHERAGNAHAEVRAVEDAKRRGHSAHGATLYVTLEPCSTQGRTPPCTDLIVRSKVARVVFAATDSNPRHAGVATRLLESHGIKVASGLLAEAAIELNADFNWWIVHQTPWVTAKIALSLDGRITTPNTDNRWLTSAPARRLAHGLRARAAAILVGGQTVRRDNPRLTVRLPHGRSLRQPWRVVWSRSGRFPPDLHLFSDAQRDRTLLFVAQTLSEVLAALGKMQIAHVLLEGGNQVLTEAFRAGLVHEVAFFWAPALNGTPLRALGRLPLSVTLSRVSYQVAGTDLLARGRVVHPEIR